MLLSVLDQLIKSAQINFVFFLKHYIKQLFNLFYNLLIWNIGLLYFNKPESVEKEEETALKKGQKHNLINVLTTDKCKNYRNSRVANRNAAYTAIRHLFA